MLFLSLSLSLSFQLHFSLRSVPLLLQRHPLLHVSMSFFSGFIYVFHSFSFVGFDNQSLLLKNLRFLSFFACSLTILIQFPFWVFIKAELLKQNFEFFGFIIVLSNQRVSSSRKCKLFWILFMFFLHFPFWVLINCPWYLKI